MGDYIKNFETYSEYNTAKSEGLEEPFVGLIEEDNKVVLSSTPKPLAYVDLGLPSGVKWATMNIGANSIDEDGMFFSWGNVQGKYADEEPNFSEGNYNTSAGKGLSGNIPTNATYDDAVANLGAPWRMPTKEEFIELHDNCSWQWIKVGKKSGVLLTSKINGKSVFFPASGYFNGTTLSDSGSCGRYWPSTFFNSNGAYVLYFNSSGVYTDDGNLRFQGCAVRPVQ